jgi:hypothetical protein
MDVAERALLAETVRQAIAGVPDVDVAAIDRVLAGLGWLDMLRAESDVAIEVVFRALGRANANATPLDDVIVHALGLVARAELGALIPPFTTWDAPGRIEGGRARADGLATARATTADAVVVVCDGGGAVRAVTVPTAATVFTAIAGIDPDAHVHVVRVDAAPAEVIPIDRASWDAAVAVAQRAVAHQIAGASEAMLDLARTHAVERVQFGRPIARFQAVRHRLADALVAIEALDAALIAAADEPSPETAALAKAIAGRTARTVAAHCQQVLAGIGFTTDHPFHRCLKRTMLLDGLFGSADELVLDIGRRLLATRHVPTLIEL